NSIDNVNSGQYNFLYLGVDNLEIAQLRIPPSLPDPSSSLPQMPIPQLESRNNITDSSIQLETRKPSSSTSQKSKKKIQIIGYYDSIESIDKIFRELEKNNMIDQNILKQYINKDNFVSK